MSQQQQVEKELQAWQQHVEQLKPQLEIAAQLQHEISSKLQQYTALDAAQKWFLAQQIQPVQNDLNQLTAQLATEQQQQQHLQQQFKQTAAWANFDENLALTLQRLQDYLVAWTATASAKPRAVPIGIRYLNWATTTYNNNFWFGKNNINTLNNLEQQLTAEQQQLQHALKSVHVLERLQQALEQWQQQTTLFEQLQQRQQETLNLQQQTQAQIQTQQQQVQITEQALQQLQLIFEQQRLLQHQSVQDLRAQLKPNEACMVCGSHEHPFIQQIKTYN